MIITLLALSSASGDQACLRKYIPILDIVRGTRNAVPSYRFDVTGQTKKQRTELLQQGLFSRPVEKIVTLRVQERLSGNWMTGLTSNGRLTVGPSAAVFEVKSPYVLNYEQVEKQVQGACQKRKQGLRLVKVGIDFKHGKANPR